MHWNDRRSVWYLRNISPLRRVSLACASPSIATRSKLPLWLASRPNPLRWYNLSWQFLEKGDA
jgi:hypothetical protein